MRPGLAAVRVPRAENVVVLVISGALGVEQRPDLDAALARHVADDVVIDLTGCTLASKSALEALDPARWGRSPGSTCAACRRSSARQLLGRAGVPRRMAVFHCVEDALQCHVMSEAGYGDGWSPTPVVRPVTPLDDYREVPTGHGLRGVRTDDLRPVDGLRRVDVPPLGQ